MFSLLKLVAANEVIGHFETAYNNCTIRYGDLKKQLAEDMVKFISPIREKTKQILLDEVYLRQVMEQGAEKANRSSAATMQLVRQAIGLNYY